MGRVQGSPIAFKIIEEDNMKEVVGTKYITKLKCGRTEILTPEELAEYLHYFTKEEIKSIYEVHKR